MRKSLASGVGVAAALMVVFGSGSASGSGEFLNGLTYAKAQESVNSFGGSIKILAREGSYLPTEECVVFGARRPSSGGAYLVNLNCNDTSALNGHPGNSSATPDGQKLVKRRAVAKQMSADFEKATAAGKTPYCLSGDAETQYCQNVCKDTGICSAELTQAIGL